MIKVQKIFLPHANSALLFAFLGQESVGGFGTDQAGDEYMFP